MSTKDFSFETIRIYWVLIALCAFSIFIVSIRTRAYYSTKVNLYSILSDYLMLQIATAATVVYCISKLTPITEWSLYFMFTMVAIFVCCSLVWYIKRESACTPIEGDDDLIRRICEALKSDERVLGREFTDNNERMLYFGMLTSLRTYHDQEFSSTTSPYPKTVKEKSAEELAEMEVSEAGSHGPSHPKSSSTAMSLANKLQNHNELQHLPSKSGILPGSETPDGRKHTWEDALRSPLKGSKKQPAKRGHGPMPSMPKLASITTLSFDAGLEEFGALSSHKEFRNAFRKTEKLGNQSLCELYSIILRILERRSYLELLSKDPESIVNGKFTALLIIFLNFFLDRTPGAINLLRQMYLKAKKQPSIGHQAKQAKVSDTDFPISMFVNTQALDSVHYCKLFHLVKLRLIGRANVAIVNQYGIRGSENPDNRWNLCTALIVISEKERVKALLKQSYIIKRKFMDEISLKGVNLGKIYDKTEKFLDCHDKLRIAFTKMNRGTRGAYFPANILEAVYLKYFLFSEVEANKKVKEAIARNQTNDTVSLFENLQSRSNEMTIIQASLEEASFQNMTFVSTNIKRFLGYDASELTNKKMPLIIPEPIASRHDLLVHPKLIQGHSLGQNMMNKTFGRGKNGYISGLGFLMKMTPMIEHGLSVTSALLFEASSIFKDIVMVLGDEGEILELSEIGSLYFRKLERMEKYSQLFASRLKEVMEMNHYILAHGKPTVEQISQEGWMMNSYQAYFELGRGSAFQMKDKHNLTRYFGSSLNLLHIPRIGKTMQILKLKLLENNIIQSGTVEDFKKIYKPLSAEAFCKLRSLSPSERFIYATMSQFNLGGSEDRVLEKLRSQAILEDLPLRSRVDISDSHIAVLNALEDIPEQPNIDNDSFKNVFKLQLNKNSNLQPPAQKASNTYVESLERYIDDPENLPRVEETQGLSTIAVEKVEKPPSPKEQAIPAEHKQVKSISSAISVAKLLAAQQLAKLKASKLAHVGNNSSFHEQNSSVPTTRYSITRNYFHSKAHEQLDSKQSSFKSRGLACLTGVWILLVSMVFVIFCTKQYYRFQFNQEISEKLNYPDLAINVYRRAVTFTDSFDSITLYRMQILPIDVFSDFYGYTDLYAMLADTWPKENGTGNALQLFDYHKILRLSIDSASVKSLHPNLELARVYVDAEIATVRDTNANRLDLRQIWGIYNVPNGQLTDWMTIFQSRFLDQQFPRAGLYNATSRSAFNLLQETLRRNMYNHVSTYLSQRCLDSLQYFRNLGMFQVGLESWLMVVAIFGSVMVVVFSILGLAMWQLSMRQMNVLVFSLKTHTFKSAHAEVIFLEDFIEKVIKSTDFHLVAKTWYAIGEPGKILQLVEDELNFIAAPENAGSRDSEKSIGSHRINLRKSDTKTAEAYAGDDDSKPRQDVQVNALKEALGVLKSAKMHMKKEFKATKMERIKVVKTHTFDSKLVVFAFKLLVVILPFLAHQMADYLQDYVSATQIRTFGDLYAVMGGIWINLELARISTDLQMAFGGNYNFNGTTVNRVFERASNQLNGYYLPELQQIKHRLPTEYAKMLTQLMETGQYCDLVQNNTKIQYKIPCGEGSTSFLKGNTISVIKSYLSLLATAQAAGSSGARTPASMAAFLATPMFKAMYSVGFMSNFADDVFYLPLLQLIPKLDTLVKASTVFKSSCFPDCHFSDMLGADEGIQNAIFVNLILMVGCLVGYFFWVSRGLQGIFRVHIAMSLLLPPELIKENLLLSKFVRSQF